MRRIKLFIATSLDGYIANPEGQIDFLNTISQDELDTTYETFIESIDTVILGSTTYLQVINDLSPDVYPYADMTSYILSHQTDIPLKENVTVLNKPVTDLITELKEQPGGDIWLVGGASIINPLIEANLIDDYHISLAPYLLGEGIPLFSPKTKELQLNLQSQTAINGMIHTHYTVK
ncbi:dihydrofolate reductase [Vagococcus coleopterorum]|uniref:Dihydrofolate reductase n=1 Tax=Vagococcus coleopterorum TaxID=2714946 RepID=A0A6G8APC6_9ENTE|nr:dihydrofolate reductase family protein [Vagococcus coleopterorum]QIL46856.1 dihydrofolate reductase [Vagococcus coleopterorum]